MNFHGWFSIGHKPFPCFYFFVLFCLDPFSVQVCNRPWGHFNVHREAADDMVLAVTCMSNVYMPIDSVSSKRTGEIR